jgi:cell division protein FtsA
MARNFTITGIDIGSGEIKILVAQRKKKEEKLEVLAGVKEGSSGVRKGIVINPEEVSRIIKICLGGANKSLERKIDSAYVNIGGNHIFSAFSHGLVSVSRADRKISKEDIDRVIQAAQTISLSSNKEILEVFPREFIVDGDRGIREPLGTEGVRLEVEALILGGFSPYLKNLTKTVLNSGIHIDDLIISPLASSRAVLTPREKELGVAMVDIGAGTTSLAVFEENNLIHTTIFPIGSSHITNDIAIGFKTDIDTAERIKIYFGSCILRGREKKSRSVHPLKNKIKLEYLTFSRKALIKIIEARVSEIFGEVNKELKKIFRKELLSAGIVLTGGGAKVPRIVELSKKELKLPTRIGCPRGFSPSQQDPSLSTVCGLVLLGADLETEGGSSVLKGISSRLKKFFKIFIP